MSVVPVRVALVLLPFWYIVTSTAVTVFVEVTTLFTWVASELTFP